MTSPADDAAPSPPSVSHADAARLVELRDVVTFELHGRRRDGGFDDLAGPLDEEDAPLPEVSVQIFANAASNENLSIRAMLAHESRMLEYTVDIAVIFKKLSDFQLTDEELGPFIDFVALPVLYPYLRQAVHDLTTRLGAAVTLNLLRVGASPVVPTAVVGVDDAVST